MKPDVKSVLTSEEFRSATWLCISIAVYNMMSGVNIINGYSTQIFDHIGDEGTFTTAQKNYFVGCSGFFGACLSKYTVLHLNRRTILIGGHFLMGIFLFLIAIFIVTKHPDLTIFSMSAFIITFQASNGALFWVYVSDIGTEATFGLCLFTLMVMLLLQSLTALPLMNSSWCGVDGMFFGLAAF